MYRKVRRGFPIKLGTNFWTCSSEVEQVTVNHPVGGSIPSKSAKQCGIRLMVGLLFSKLIATVRFCYPAPVFAVLAQSVEHLPCKQDVVSSIPTDSTKHGSIAHLGERQLCKLDVVGSSPTGSTKLGCRQVVRHRILIPTFRGSNPLSPAKIAVVVEW